ncbi:MAG: hypothetical protein JWP52_3731 [Rhizobacter sp.]|nr:hypothetical protein [Rhizobacter sp.]
MQIAPLALERRPSAKLGGDVASANDTAAPAADAPTPKPSSLRPARGADRPTHRDTSSAQQALAYVERMAAHLQDLKASLTRKMAQPQHDEPSLADDLRAVADQWSNRSKATGGALDSQLHYSGPDSARQSFTVRGLDASALASPERETLSFTVGNGNRTVMSTTFEPGSTAKENTQKLDRALAASGVRVKQGSQGEPVFDVAESAWPDVRDSMSVKGGGFRFPAGQLNKVRTLPQGDAMTPQTWQSETASVRRTLQEVTQALDRIRQVAAKLHKVLDEAALPVAPSEQAWAQTFVGEFSAVAGQSDYRIQSSLAPALLGLNRSRVLSLLALG